MNVGRMDKRCFHMQVVRDASRIQDAASASTFRLTCSAFTALTSLPCEALSPLLQPLCRKQLAVVIATAGLALPRQPRADILGGQPMREAINFPRLTSFSILLQNFLKPRVGSAIGRCELMQTLDRVSCLSPKECHCQLLCVVHVVVEGIAVETNLHDRWQLPPISAETQVQPPKRSPAPIFFCGV